MMVLATFDRGFDIMISEKQRYTWTEQRTWCWQSQDLRGLAPCLTHQDLQPATIKCTFNRYIQVIFINYHRLFEPLDQDQRNITIWYEHTTLTTQNQDSQGIRDIWRRSQQNLKTVLQGINIFYKEHVSPKLLLLQLFSPIAKSRCRPNFNTEWSSITPMHLQFVTIEQMKWRLSKNQQEEEHRISLVTAPCVSDKSSSAQDTSNPAASYCRRFSGSERIP